MLNCHDGLVGSVELHAPTLAAGADQVERDGVQRPGLDELAAMGLYGILGPRWAGGSEANGATYRRVAELLAGADGNTWLVWFQHHPVVRMVAASGNDELQRQLPDLCAGRLQAGVAFSHLRNQQPTIVAEADGSGWRCSGRQPWCSGWGLIDVILVGSVTADDQVVLAVVPADRAGLRSSGELDLMAMGGSRTVSLELDGLAVAADEVALQVPRSAWVVGDALRASNVQPSAVGISLAALEVLRTQAPDAAARLSVELAALRDQAYALADEDPTADDVAERLRLAAALLRLGVEITSTLVASAGGSAMALSQPAQRWAREATFHLVFAQTIDLRSAVLSAAAGA